MFDCYDTLITPEEVADMLGCGMNTTYKLLKSGKIKGHEDRPILEDPQESGTGIYYTGIPLEISWVVT